MLRLRLIHKVTVRRASHTIVDKEKQRSLNTVGTDVPCLVQPVSAAETVTLLGQSGEVTYQVFFDGTADVRARDQLSWSGRSKELEVMTVQEHHARLGGQPRIIEAICMEVT
jgi:hypothetical protein